MRVLGHPDDFMPLYNQLMSDSKKNQAVIEAIDNVKQQLEQSQRPLGAHHRKSEIPDYYITRYGLQVLYHFDMPDFHRLMYTIRKSPSGGGKEALLLELISHDTYNKRFGYFKKKSH